MTVTMTGPYFPGEQKPTETLYNSLLAFLAVLPSANFQVLTLLRQKKDNQKETFKFWLKMMATPAIELFGSVI